MFLIPWLSCVFVFSHTHTHTMLCVLVHKDTSFSLLFDDRLIMKKLLSAPHLKAKEIHVHMKVCEIYYRKTE